MATPAAAIMQRFAERTGLTGGEPAAPHGRTAVAERASGSPPGKAGGAAECLEGGHVTWPATRRYLWTDAFAVCNFLGLAASGELAEGVPLALRLVNAVHHVLGRHRSDDTRRGWISGLDEAAGESRPTAGGLRIGKRRPERAEVAAPDARAEWDQDGQYFHYLTRWMHALDQTRRATGEAVYGAWARELAARAFQAFSYEPAPGAPRRMYWKTSIDLSRPLVPAMGHHDPLDGYLTCLQLQAAERAPGAPTPNEPALDEEVQALAAMVAGGDWATADPLGLGSLMIDAWRLYQIERHHPAAPRDLLPSLLDDAARGLEQVLAQQPWQGSAHRRLAFRELGLAIGLQAVARLRDQLPMGEPRDLAARLGRLVQHATLADHLTRFWLDGDNRRAMSWTEHEDINDVMLATALAPSGYLELREVDHGHA